MAGDAKWGTPVPALVVDHRSPCPALEEHARDNSAEYRRIYDKVDDPETGLGAHSRAIANSYAWQERMEMRINQLFYITLAALASGVVTFAYLVVMKH